MPSGSNHAVRFDHCGACTMPAFIERVDVPRADQIPPSATEGTLVSIFRGIRGWGWKPIRQTGQASARRASHASYLLLAFAGLLVVLCLSASAATDSTPAVKNPQPHTTRNAVENVLQHARQLATRLHSEADPARLQPLVVQLGALEQRVSALPTVENDTLDELRELESQAHSLARQIAFCNPRLDFDKLLFIKRHDSAGVYHMCDQYYGCNAKPGGGLFVLEHPLSDHPHVVNLLQDSVVQNGRLKGHKLEGGSFLSPELSFDGQTILFAYSEAQAWEKYQGSEAYEWKPEYSYHIFKCTADGSNLVQLTDGPWDDFDPCFLPNGRIVFISERRGGYLRCGRHCPVYTMHSMEADGSDIIRLSHHETHEWHPSVTNDGMIVYTRWDYVDRDTNIAHHIWTCFPTGAIRDRSTATIPTNGKIARGWRWPSAPFPIRANSWPVREPIMATSSDRWC